MRGLKRLYFVLSLVFLDIVVLTLAFIIAFFSRKYFLPLFIRFSLPPLPLKTLLWPGFAAMVLITELILALNRHYHHHRSFWDETRSLIRSLNTSFILIILMVFFSRSYELFSRVVIILCWLLALFLFPLFHYLARTYLLPASWWRKKAIIIGPKPLAHAVITELKKNPMLGLDAEKIIEPDLLTKVEGDYDRQITFQDKNLVEELYQKIEELKHNSNLTIIINSGLFDQKSLLKLIEKCEALTSDIRIIPDFGTFFASGVQAENLGDVLSLIIPRNLVKPWNLILKRIVELILSFLLLLLFFPLMLLIALAIKIDSPGPVFYIQKRLGYKGQVFNLLKFRSMFTDSEKRLEEYFRLYPEKKKEWQEFQKLRGEDPRVTRVGRFIRRYSLDELPQLINVLKGEMSLVGPRPYLPEEKEALGEKAAIITKCRPGITGLWQVSGRNLLPFKERILLDEYYLRNWSLWLDAVIAFKTIRSFLSGEGAF